MIPPFPEFKPLEWSDRAEFETYTSWLAPHSDFNFTSIWAWNINETMQLSKLNDNLVILFNDYLTREHYLSFAGKNRITETAQELIRFSEANYGVSILKYVPEEVASQIVDPNMVASIDEANCDYICRVSDFAESDKLTKKHGPAGQRCRMFLKLYPEYQTKVCPMVEADKNELRKLFQIWAENKSLKVADLVEYKAFERYFQLTEANIKVLTIQVDDKLIGFSTLEILTEGFATCEFMKFDPSYKAMFQISLWKMCEYLHQEGIIYLNLQVDLGSANLKASKNKCHSKLFLRRYMVENIDNVRI